MTACILDTHVLLWFFHNDSKIPQKIHRIILDGTVKKHVSVASMWEIAIKNRIGKLPLTNGVASIFNEVENNGFGRRRINRKCIEIYNALPLLHRDPFDGIIVATSIEKNMPIITADENIRQYGLKWVW